MVNASGEIMRVPNDYLNALGKVRAASDPGQGSKELHAVAAYRKDGRYPSDAVLVREVFEIETTTMTAGTVSHGQSAWEGLQTGRPTSRRCREGTRSQHDVRVDARSDESLDTLAEARIPMRLAAIWSSTSTKWRRA